MRLANRKNNVENLTEIERRAIDADVNLADGHPRQSLTEAQTAIVQNLPRFVAEARVIPLQELEARAHKAFMRAVGQHSIAASGRIFSVYSSSIATMALGYILAERQDTVALLHPTFDNIHDLLARSVAVVPITEEAAEVADLDSIVSSGATCLFLTTPNNPTGWVLSKDSLTRVATKCAEEGLLLCLDVSFRGFDGRSQFDTYAVLEEAGVDYVVIEDTGKLWPIGELKLGFIVASETIRSQLDHALSDILLSVSPVILRLVEELAHDAAAGGLSALHSLISENRQTLQEAANHLNGIELLNPEARVSVGCLKFPSAGDARRVLRKMRQAGVHLLPCDAFHWNSRNDGADTLRIALSRDASVIRNSVACIASEWSSVEFQPALSGI